MSGHGSTWLTTGAAGDFTLDAGLTYSWQRIVVFEPEIRGRFYVFYLFYVFAAFLSINCFYSCKLPLIMILGDFTWPAGTACFELIENVGREFPNQKAGPLMSYY